MKAIRIKFDDDIFNDVYRPYYLNESRYLNLWGSAGSGKSCFATQKFIIRCLKERDHRFLLVRKVARTIRESQYALIKDFVYKYNLESLFQFREDLKIIAPNNNMFLPAGLDDVEKLKSIHRITGIWNEEVTEYSLNDFMQVDTRLRGKTEFYKQIISTYNPINQFHWVKSYFHDKNLDNCSLLHTTYKDNKFIDTEYKELLESYKDIDETHYKIYTLGEWATYKNIIYEKWSTYKAAPEGIVIYGIDFGYSTSATAVIKCTIKDKNIYLEELLYQTKLTNSDLIEYLKFLIKDKTDFIYVDSSEPQRIEEIHRAGFNVYGAIKNINAGIEYIKSFNILIHANSIKILNEIKSYKYKEDRNGIVQVNQDGKPRPVKLDDHAMDAIRYAVFTYGSKYLLRQKKLITSTYKASNSTIYDGYNF